ncbi:alpha/beta fold hydrolase [Ureibacillus thermosphaericus]|uniref:alpha/beta fold hydrolase n=1 Tax=Ureibacillus thermosphaericus TaxID=51173 RepID=UPI000BBC12B6|nr:alpha/beta hydrolase [Ureibacillus thermosphaericus]
MNIVFIPGWGMKGEIFASLARSLRHLGDVSFIEWGGIESISSFRERAKQALHARSVLIGWSLGSLVALEMAHENPKLVSHLVLIGGTSRFVTAAGYDAGWHPRIVERMKKQLQRHPGETINAFLASLLTEEENADLSDYFHRDRTKELLIGLDYLLTADARLLLPEIHVPMLLIHGERDAICPPDASRHIAAHARAATLALFSNTGHVPFVTKTEECAQLIQWFVGEKDDR